MAGTISFLFERVQALKNAIKNNFKNFIILYSLQVTINSLLYEIMKFVKEKEKDKNKKNGEGFSPFERVVFFYKNRVKRRESVVP